MSQEIKIPVNAQTHGAERGLGNLEGAAEGVADAVGAIQKQSDGAAESIKRLIDKTAELARQRQELSKILGQPLVNADVELIQANFDRLRRLRGHYGRQARMANGPAELLEMVDRVYADRPTQLARARGEWSASLTQGTRLARPPAPPEPPEPPPGGGDDFGRGMSRIQNHAMSFGKSMLALAGITSAMAMASKAVDLATEEAVGTDTLKRRLGDVGVDYNRLRDQTRAASAGLGVSWVESQRLGRAYAEEAGNLKPADVETLGSRLHTAMGFGRSFGADPATAVQFFGQMAKYGIGRDEGSQRRLALLIGDAVAKSTYGGDVQGILREIANYTATAARATLTNASSDAYANAFTSLMGRGLPGLDSVNSAALLGKADQAIRGGGAMGDASKTFLYAMLRNRYPGINPVEAQAVMEGGLFASTRSTFGPIMGADGQVHANPLRQFMGQKVPLDSTTMFEMVVGGLRRSYGRSPWGGSMVLDAAANTFGVTHAQAAALMTMSDRGELGSSLNALHGAGIDPTRLNATGFAMIAQLANAKGRGALNSAFGSIMGRSDLTDAQRRVLQGALTSTQGLGDEGARQALVSAVAKLNIAQERTPGSETRDALVGINDALTDAGKPLLTGVNGIRDAVLAIANHLMPGYMDATGTDAVKRGAGILGLQGKEMAPIERGAMNYLMSQGWSRVQAAAILGGDMAESSPNLDPMAFYKNHRGIAQWDRDRWESLKSFSAGRGLDPNNRMTQLAFQDWELKHSQISAGQYLRSARTPFEAAAAMLRYERPEGFDPLHPERAVLWGERLTQAVRLARPPVPAHPHEQPADQHIHVHIHHPSGRREHRVIKAHTAAKPAVAAGSQAPKRPSGDGRAPLVGGHIDYPTSVDYGS